MTTPVCTSGVGNRVTRRIGRERGVLVIDLAAKMPKSSRLYYDFSHYTNVGAKEVAKIIYDDLSGWLKERFPDYLKQ